MKSKNWKELKPQITKKVNLFKTDNKEVKRHTNQDKERERELSKLMYIQSGYWTSMRYRVTTKSGIRSEKEKLKMVSKINKSLINYEGGSYKCVNKKVYSRKKWSL